MNTSLNRKDIEDFWRRSNSICDQESEDPENLHVQVRRMSLAEFNGLAGEPKLADIETPTWKSSVSQSSLLNSFSNRRRSILPSDTYESPARRLATQSEEDMDIQTAISRLKSIETTCQKSQSCDKLLNDLSSEKSKASDAINRIQIVVKQLNQIPSSSTSTIQSLLPETVSAATFLAKTINNIKINTTVYHSELLSTELNQVFCSITSFIAKLDNQTMSANISTPTRKLSLVASSYSQLIANLNVLNRAVSSV
ncbi:unnamed protein product [Caenorhabditis angaria]|uniref:Uncharacterized protein n=1 Tax=Caenorhabditis angaria TaxID=860376 RepID=A0A9P1ILE0_9PELO|nr:unnamed protein product [Caenorhabditis angaria]